MKFSFNSKKIFIRPYYGYGDWLSLNGMIRFLTLNYDEVNLIIDGTDENFIRNLYRDNHKIKFLYECQFKEEDLIHDQLDLQIYKDIFREGSNIYNKLNPIGKKFGFDTEQIDCNCYNRLESPHNFNKNCRDILVDNASSFYVAAGIPKEFRMDRFYYRRNYDSENIFFNSLNLPKKYNVICEYGENLIHRKYIKNSDLPIVNLHNLSEKYFDIIKIIENAEEVHLIENSISLLVYHMQFKKLMNPIRINMHTYARREECRRCTNKVSNVYLDMFLNPKLENWNFIYLENYEKN